MTSLDIVSIATNGYTKYWHDMIKSFQDNNKVFQNVVAHIITDDPKFVTDYASKNSEIRFVVHQIESMPWPLPTLMRYTYISKITKFLVSENFLYIDSDMKFHPGFELEMETALRRNQINLVIHPGYWRSNNLKSIKTELPSVKFVISDLYRKLRLGGLGAWEVRRKSTAFVSRKNRRIYVCGGVWFGKRDLIVKMINTLKFETEVDLRNGIISKWHDESHLNKWFATNGANLLDPSFCFDPRLSNLVGLTPRIEAIVKDQTDRI